MMSPMTEIVLTVLIVMISGLPEFTGAAPEIVPIIQLACIPLRTSGNVLKTGNYCICTIAQ